MQLPEHILLLCGFHSLCSKEGFVVPAYQWKYSAYESYIIWILIKQSVHNTVKKAAGFVLQVKLIAGKINGLE